MDNLNKFSWAQMTSNTDGKTSGSGTVGVWYGLVSGICFLAATAYFIAMKGEGNSIVLFSSITGLATIAAALLGYRKSKDAATEPQADGAEKV